VAARPDDPELRSHLAEAKARAGQVDEARDLYESARRLAQAQGALDVVERASKALEALGKSAH
jgi:Flp pilus assembly protein TadD